MYKCTVGLAVLYYNFLVYELDQEHQDEDELSEVE